MHSTEFTSLQRLMLAAMSIAVGSTPPGIALADDESAVAPHAPSKAASRHRVHGEGAPEAGDGKQGGNASFYAKHLSGRRTASGESYDPGALTAAHRTLPMGTKVRVVNPKNDRSVVVTVNDRGPVAKNRVIDVSSAAAHQLGMTKSGVTKVETEVVGRPGSTP